MIRAILALLVCLLMLRGAAAAQSGEVAPAAEQATETDAKQLYTAGKLAYAAGEFDEAIALFERAYALSEAPGLLFNLAQAHRLAGEPHCAQARALYKSYLGAVPAADNRHEVEERIAELTACAEQAEHATETVAPTAEPPTPVAPVPEPPGPPQRARRALLGPILLSVAGAVTVIAAGVLYARAAAEYRDAERRCPCYPGTLTKWERLTYVSYAGLGVGSAALLAGASWWASGMVTDRGTTALVTLHGRF